MVYIPSIKRYCLATAEILYHLPDYPDLLQTFIWQEIDTLPELPQLHKFLRFWESEIEGKIHSVSVARSPITPQRELVYTPYDITLN